MLPSDVIAAAAAVTIQRYDCSSIGAFHARRETKRNVLTLFIETGDHVNLQSVSINRYSSSQLCFQLVQHLSYRSQPVSFAGSPTTSFL